MNAPSVDIREMLEAYGESSGVSVDFATAVFIGHEPDLPNTSITIFDAGAYPPLLGLTTHGYEYPAVQIRVRSTRYLDGWAIIEEIKQALHGRAQETWNGVLYSMIRCSNGPALLDYDDRNRCRFVINFDLQRREV